MKWHWSIPVVAALLAGLAAFAFTRHAVCPHPQTDQPVTALQKAAFLTRTLDLSVEQQEQAHALHAELAANLEECCVHHCSARMRLGAALCSTSNDDADLEALIKDLSEAYADSERAAVEHIRNLREILTPTQRERFDEMLEKAVCSSCPVCETSVQKK